MHISRRRADTICDRVVYGHMFRQFAFCFSQISNLLYPTTTRWPVPATCFAATKPNSCGVNIPVPRQPCPS